MNLESILFHFFLGAISFISNLLSGFAGGGAGLVQLPALIFLGLPFQIALATHKVASVALGIGATFRHSRERTLNPFMVMLILSFGLPGVWLGARTILFIPEQLAMFLLGALTLFLGIFSANSPQLGTTDRSTKLSNKKLFFGGIVLFGIGFINGSLTSGTGLFVTIWLVSWFGLSYAQAVAYTLVLVGIFWNGTGALVLGTAGEIKWSWIPILLVGSLAGGYFGAHLSIAKGSFFVKRAFEFLTILVGISLIGRAFS